jgi:glycosyltransferase involved in cell wall biosynthesis
LFFHASVPPSELLSRAAEHDVGLALEQGTVLNRALCATNKLFLYMLAGLAIAATDVPGQRSVLANEPGGALYPPGDYRALATILEEWRSKRAALNNAKAAALELARDRWNWEIERNKLVETVRRFLEVPDDTTSASDEAQVALRCT